MTPERLDLARINTEIAQTIARRAEAQAEIDRLTGPESEVAQVEASLAQLRAQRDRDRAAWNEAGCPGAPPTEPADLITQEKALAALRERDGVNDGTLGAARSVVQRCEFWSPNIDQRGCGPPEGLWASVWTRM